MRRVVQLLAILLVAACGDSTKPAPTLTGKWIGQLEVSTIRLDLTQTATTLSGTGSVAAGTTAFPLNAAGTVNGVNFAVTLTSSGFSPMNFSGTFGETTMTGIVNGSGFQNAAVTLTRQ